LKPQGRFVCRFSFFLPPYLWLGAILFALSISNPGGVVSGGRGAPGAHRSGAGV